VNPDSRAIEPISQHHLKQGDTHYQDHENTHCFADPTAYLVDGFQLNHAFQCFSGRLQYKA
jgi:hypothetical protein